MLNTERQAFYDEISDTMTVMQYEMGAVAQNIIYAKRADEVGRRALHANALLELGDLLAQCAVLSLKIQQETPGLYFAPSWDELVRVGRERQIDRMERIIAGEQRDPSMSEG
ncbi:hypothetical protein LCGC14_0422370 [marine sediment metagenome]|uniref:PhoU domain-containing protein n=1 Tax=marine sediment metagenome TaxID=412755 RepID=A0A0F9T8Q1_9ZZZZ